MATRSSPRMFAATTSAWYLPVVVNGQMPVTSPMAQSPSPARSRSSTGIPVLAGGDADRLEPDAFDAWATTGGDEEAVTTDRGRRRSRGRSRRRLFVRRAALAPSTSSMPSRRRTSPSASPSGAGSLGSTCSATSTSTTSPPRRRTACAISTPTAPPPSTTSRRGTAVIPVTSRLVHTPSRSREARDGRDDRRGAVREDDVVGGVAVAGPPRPRPVRRAARRRAAGRCRGR